jgi:hypothetical protein
MFQLDAGVCFYPLEMESAILAVMRNMDMVKITSQLLLSQVRI